VIRSVPPDPPKRSPRKLAGTNLAARELRVRFQAWHTSGERLNDKAIDRMLGVREQVVERRIDEVGLILKFGNEKFTYGGTPYAVVRKVMRTLCPNAGDVFYDLGAGYGRVLFYGALTSRARFRGIELVPERVTEARSIQKRLCLRNVEIRQENARLADFSEGNLFFLYDPFFQDVLTFVGGRLREIARHRTIRIASLAVSNDYFVAQKWLQEFVSPYVARQPGRRYGLRFFVSVSGLA
jgi:SAM-dependent methyltransferase